MLPLEGITVVSIEQAVAAPFATRQLADLGARVIKIERPDGGDFARGYDTAVNGLSSYFVWLNRSKESLTLDLKRPDIRDLLKRLVERADVFVQNLAPGAADRLGVSAAVPSGARPAAHRVQRLGLRLVRAVRGEEGLRPAGAKRGRPALDHRDGRVAGTRGDFGRRHRRRHVRLLRAS